MKKFLTIGVVLLVAVLTLRADDYRWVKCTYKWSGTGTLCTQAFPLFGDDFRIQYASQKGALKITLVDLSEGKRLPPRIVVDAKHLVDSSSREFSDRKMAYLVIEGDSRAWTVVVDQYLDSVQEWRLKSYLEKLEQAPQGKLLGMWTDLGPQKIQFTPQEQPWRLDVSREEAGSLKVTVRAADQKILYQGSLRGASDKTSGWFHSLDFVTIEVECAPELPWTLEAVSGK